MDSKLLWVKSDCFFVHPPPAKKFILFRTWLSEVVTNSEVYFAEDINLIAGKLLQKLLYFQVVNKEEKELCLQYLQQKENAEYLLSLLPEFLALPSEVDYSKFPEVKRTEKGKLIKAKNDFAFQEHYQPTTETGDFFGATIKLMGAEGALKVWETFSFQDLRGIVDSLNQREILSNPDLREWLTKEKDSRSAKNVLEKLSDIPGRIDQLRQMAIDKIRKPLNPVKVSEAQLRPNRRTNSAETRPAENQKASADTPSAASSGTPKFTIEEVGGEKPSDNGRSDVVSESDR